MALVRGRVWGGGLPPPQIIVINFFLFPPNTPFLLPVPIIDYAIIITNCCTTAASIGLGFCVRVMVLVSVTDSVSYLNYKFVLL